MICPYCGNTDTKVVDSRETKEGRAIRRRRECERCSARFSTYEEAEIVAISVMKKDGRKEDYDRKKIEAGLRRALEKRPGSEEKADRILDEIEYDLHAKHVSEVTSKEIGRIALEKLKETDEVAYIRFASVYQSFGSAERFKKAIENLE
jgi:transcriptional repressor NrdR